MRKQRLEGGTVSNVGGTELLGGKKGCNGETLEPANRGRKGGLKTEENQAERNRAATNARGNRDPRVLEGWITRGRVTAALGHRTTDLDQKRFMKGGGR